MIPERSIARAISLQALYQLDVQGEDFLINQLNDFVNESTNEPRIRELALNMTRGAWAFHTTADQWFGRIAEKWPVYRMATVDRNILRLGAWEITHNPLTPSKVALDEALQLTKEYSTADAVAFINGILDVVLREHQALTANKSPTDSHV